MIANARQILATQLPENHWRTAWAGSVQGASLARQEKFKEAEELLLPSLAMLKQEPGSRSRTVYIDLTNGYLADMYRKWGKSAQAARYDSR